MTVPRGPPALPSAVHPRLAPGHAAVTALPGFQHHLWLWGPAREGCSCVNLSPQDSVETGPRPERGQLCSQRPSRLCRCRIQGPCEKSHSLPASGY